MTEYKLKYKNKWGNYNQFTDENGKQEYKNNLIINHMSGLEIEKWRNENIDEFIKAQKIFGQNCNVLQHDILNYYDKT